MHEINFVALVVLKRLKFSKFIKDISSGMTNTTHRHKYSYIHVSLFYWPYYLLTPLVWVTATAAA